MTLLNLFAWFLHVLGVLAIWLSTFIFVVPDLFFGGERLKEYYRFAPKFNKLDELSIVAGASFLIPAIAVLSLDYFLWWVQWTLKNKS